MHWYEWKYTGRHESRFYSENLNHTTANVTTTIEMEPMVRGSLEITSSDLDRNMPVVSEIWENFWWKNRCRRLCHRSDSSFARMASISSRASDFHSVIIFYLYLLHGPSWFLRNLRLVPAQDVPYALILWYASKIMYSFVGIGTILNKELELIFRSDCSDCTCVYS